jgi:RsiW-degrading membrane proteinase PrsW (M82 family)
VTDVNSESKDLIAEQLDLDHNYSFSVKDFLSQTLVSHSWEEFETKLSVGTAQTTPALHAAMTVFPKPWVFVQVLTGSLLTYLLLLALLSHYQLSAINLIPALIFTGCFAVPIAVLTLFFEMNTTENVSVVFVSKLVLVGGALSFLLTFALFDYFPILEKLYGAASAGFIEEIAKFAAVLILGRKLIKSRHPFILNGILYGAAVGTGFAGFESAGYALRAGLESNSFKELNDLIIMRGMLSPFMHITWTAIAAGAFWMVYAKTQDVFKSIFSGKFLSFLAISVGIHFLWNFPLIETLSLPETFSYIKLFLLGILSWMIVFRLAFTGFQEIRIKLQS